MINAPTQEGDEGLHREMEMDVALSIPAALQVRSTFDTFIKLALQQMDRMNQQVESS